MKYVISYRKEGPASEIPRSGVARRRLLDQASIDTVSAACRSAALGFISGVTSGWSKRNLAEWLAGPYAQATIHASGGERTVADDTSDLDLGPHRIEDLMLNARMHALALAEELALPSSESHYVEEAVMRAFVLPAEDQVDTFLWIPADAKRMRLRDRVRTLLVADYLNCAAEYERALVVCHRCESVTFDEDAKHIGFCKSHMTKSGTVGKYDPDREELMDDLEISIDFEDVDADAG